MVDGEFELWLDDRSTVRGPGAYVTVAPGRRHSWWNPADRSATYISVMSPGGFERYFVELAAGLRQVATDDHARPSGID